MGKLDSDGVRQVGMDNGHAQLLQGGDEDWLLDLRGAGEVIRLLIAGQRTVHFVSADGVLGADVSRLAEQGIIHLSLRFGLLHGLSPLPLHLRGDDEVVDAYLFFDSGGILLYGRPRSLLLEILPIIDFFLLLLRRLTLLIHGSYLFFGPTGVPLPLVLLVIVLLLLLDPLLICGESNHLDRPGVRQSLLDLIFG